MFYYVVAFVAGVVLRPILDEVLRTGTKYTIKGVTATYQVGITVVDTAAEGVKTAYQAGSEVVDTVVSAVGSLSAEAIAELEESKRIKEKVDEILEKGRRKVQKIEKNRDIKTDNC